MNITPILKKKYPEGASGGQCVQFCHKFIEFPSVGDSYAQKKKSVDMYGIRKENLSGFQIGDVVITSDGTMFGRGNGHAFLVADQDKTRIIAAESNFRNDQRVHYGRVVLKDSSKIYGVIRGDYLFDAGIPTPLTFNATILMQYQKQWDSKIFQELIDKVLDVSAGRIKLNITPLYTYSSLKNWWYKTYLQNYDVIAREYFENQVLPLISPNSHIAIWSINTSQWQGSIANSPGYTELGWYYPDSKPMMATVVCEEDTLSFYNYGEKAFTDYIIHELGHFFQNWGRGDQRDYTHTYYNARNMKELFNQIDYERLGLNL